MVEHLVCNQGVVGSSPIVSTMSLMNRDPEHSRRRKSAKLFDKLGWWNEIVEKISSENQIKLERVYVRMPRHQEPTKDVA